MHIPDGLRSKRFRGAKSEETGFSAICPREKWGEGKNKKEGVGEGKEGNMYKRKYV